MPQVVLIPKPILKPVNPIGAARGALYIPDHVW